MYSLNGETGYSLLSLIDDSQTSSGGSNSPIIRWTLSLTEIDPSLYKIMAFKKIATDLN
jgi:hypothetical protein